METGYIVAAFGSMQSQKDLDVFKKKSTQNSNKGFFKRFSFFKGKENEKIETVSFISSKEFAEKLSKILNTDVLPFDLYFPERNKAFLENLKNSKIEKWIVFPLSAIFNHNLSSGSAKFFSDSLEEKLLDKIFWIRSFAKNRSFISYYQKKIKEFLFNNDLLQKESILIFSACLENINLDMYKQSAFELTKEILKGFPYILGKNIFSLEGSPLEDLDLKERKNVIFISLSNLCTNYENFIFEKNVFPLIKNSGLTPYSLSFTFDKDWQIAMEDILQEELTLNKALLLK